MRKVLSVVLMVLVWCITNINVMAWVDSVNEKEKLVLQAKNMKLYKDCYVTYSDRKYNVDTRNFKGCSIKIKADKAFVLGIRDVSNSTRQSCLNGCFQGYNELAYIYYDTPNKELTVNINLARGMYENVVLSGIPKNIKQTTNIEYIKLYGVENIVRNVSVSTPYNKVGDNTKVVLKLNYEKTTDDILKVYNKTNSEVYYESKDRIDVIGVEVPDGKNLLVVEIVGLDKKSKAYTEIDIDSVKTLQKICDLVTKNSKDEINIMGDGGYYYENNDKNKSLIDSLIMHNSNISITGSILDENKELFKKLIK